MSEDRHPYDEIASAVGDVCLHWVNIEQVIHEITLHLAVYIDPSFEKLAARDVLHIALSPMGVREKISIAKVLAHHVDTPDSLDFYERTEALMNYLDNNARPERNRYVHDHWGTEGREVVRARLGAKVHRPQSRQRTLSLWSERRYESLVATREFVKNLELAYQDLVELDNHIAWLIVRRDTPGSHQQPLRSEWRSSVHRDWREPDKH